MPRDILPTDIVNTLALHGPVEFVTGTDAAPVRRQEIVAPFEDVIYVLMPKRTPHEEGLLSSWRAELHARDKGGAYRVNLRGRSRAPISLLRIPHRSQLEVWLPDDAGPERYVVAPFITEHISFVRREKGGDVVYEGPSKVENPPMWRRWLSASLFGWAGPFSVAVAAATWGWLTLEGPEVPWRAAAWAMSTLSGVLTVGSVRMLLLALGFHRWRAGRARAKDAQLLVDGLLHPRALVRAGLFGLGFAAVTLALTAQFWGLELAGLAFAVSGAWLAGPAWLLHLSMSSPEERD